MLSRFSKRLFLPLIWGPLVYGFENPLFCDTILVTNTNSGFGPGSLGAALFEAGDGSIIDCSPIAGQTISISTPLPAIGFNFTSPTSSLMILGSGVTIDGGATHSIGGGGGLNGPGGVGGPWAAAALR
jgi:hypothetical protein